MTGRIVLTCEHGGKRIPVEFAARFRGHSKVLESHVGVDHGASTVARALARSLDAPLFISTVSRLLIDLNRSLHHPRLFSEFVRDLDPEVRAGVLERYYWPYRQAVEERIAEWISGGARVLHLSVHSFTPAMNGKVRNAEVGVLYDSLREEERRLAAALQRLIASRDLRVRRNYPYRGTADGFTTHLRRRFTADSYCGLEIELNQGRFDTRPQRLAIARILDSAIRAIQPERLTKFGLRPPISTHATAPRERL